MSANDKNHWATPHKSGWQSKTEGASRASRVFDTQAEAWDHAKDAARTSGGEAYLQGRNGQIRERNTYGYDPKKTKG